AAQVVHGHHRICHNIVHLCLVRLCNITIQAQTPADYMVCRVIIGCPLPSITNLHSARSKNREGRSWLTPPTLDTHSFSVSPL
ncbi:hypothetical protein LDENG_00219620, partial [Lucifuga dentata]